MLVLLAMTAHLSHAAEVHGQLGTPRMVVMPLLVATTSTGAMSCSSALFSQLKHSMSSMCTCAADKMSDW